MIFQYIFQEKNNGKNNEPRKEQTLYISFLTNYPVSKRVRILLRIGQWQDG